METEGFFAQNTLFTRDAWLAFRQNRETKQSGVNQLLKYYVAKKRLIRVRKGCMQLLRREAMPLLWTSILLSSA